LIGGIKWNRKSLAAELFKHPLQMLDRLAAAGMSWGSREVDPGNVEIVAGIGQVA
jgi:hypothetical protein